MAPRVTRWAGGHNQLATSTTLFPISGKTDQGLSCRVLDLQWTVYGIFCVGFSS